jgi:predicted nucleotidyltransferase
MDTRLKRLTMKAARGLPMITAYLFGSTARGDQGPLSDYDIAVQAASGLTSRQRFQLKLDLIERLSRSLKTDRIDVVILEDAPPLLAHRILKEGKILYCRNPLQRVRNEFRLLNEYLDFQEDLDRFAQETLGFHRTGALRG